jgi:hypothetical protein
MVTTSAAKMEGVDHELGGLLLTRNHGRAILSTHTPRDPPSPSNPDSDARPQGACEERHAGLNEEGRTATRPAMHVVAQVWIA